jgi:hypothetical protein
LICVLTATVCLATIWFALGGGSLLWRTAFFLAAVAVAGGAMFGFSERMRVLYGEWPEPILVNTTVTLGHLWGAWFALVGGLLAAMLLFLRAAGYRLAKNADRENAVSTFDQPR